MSKHHENWEKQKAGRTEWNWPSLLRRRRHDGQRERHHLENGRERAARPRVPTRANETRALLVDVSRRGGSCGLREGVQRVLRDLT